ncbi:9966_t:CDS:2 [Paraglomus occultum]|uniref:9966_t:CDS:1 n=1 Tax=Paraglomus occultum TaxID=144539 RepID=A0A9N9F6T8_9GLOM|nr:9966_t:CDS:2 [Paraglomus occultum]
MAKKKKRSNRLLHRLASHEQTASNNSFSIPSSIIYNILSHLPPSSPSTLPTLRSCQLINHSWCEAALRTFWEQPFYYSQSYKILEKYLEWIGDEEWEKLATIGLFKPKFRKSNNSPPRKKWIDYPSLIKHLDYVAMLDASHNYIDRFASIMDESSSISSPVSVLMQCIFTLFQHHGVRLESLSMDTHSRDVYDIEFDDEYMILAVREYGELVEHLKRVEIKTGFNKERLFLWLAGNCRELTHVDINMLRVRTYAMQQNWDENASLFTFLKSQRHIIHFHLSNFDSDTSEMELISPAISSFSNELSSLVFTDVDFRGCGPLDSIAECDNLQRLWFENVDNLDEEMVDPIVYKKWAALKDVVASGGVCGRILEWIDNRKMAGESRDENMGYGEFGHGGCGGEGNFNNFYGAGKIELLFTVLGCIGIVGFFLMIILVLIFIVLPSTKHNPVIKKILLPLAVSVLLFSAADFFSIDQRRTQCVDEVEPATIRNNKLCAAQAFFELAGAYAVALWASVLIINLHMLSVWRSDFVLRNIKYFHVPVWIMVFLAAFLPMMLNQVESGGFCFVSHKATPIFYYILSFIFPVCLLHLVTLAYMAKVSNRANSRRKEARMSFSEAQVLFVHIKHVIKVQWRAFMGAAFMLVVYLTDFYFTFSTRKFVITPNTVWFQQWVECMEQTGDQDGCASYAIVPSFVLQVIVLTLNRSVGVVIFIIFAGKKSVFKEMIRLITRNPGEESILGLSSIPDVRGSRMSSIAKRSRLEDYERGRSKGGKKPELRKIDYNPRNLEGRKGEQSRIKRTNRKPGNNRSRRETREAKTRATNSEPVTEIVVNAAVLPPLPIPASPPPSLPTYTPSNHPLLPPKLHLPPPPPFDPPTSLSPRPRKAYSPVQYIGDSNPTAFQPVIMQATDVTSADVQISSPSQNDYSTDLNTSQPMQVSDFTSTEVEHTDTLVRLPAQHFYGTSSDASQPSLSQFSDVPSIEDQYTDMQVSSPAQNDYGTNSNGSQPALNQLSDVPSTEVQCTQVSSSAQNDYDKSVNASPPVIRVSDFTSPEDEYTDMQVSSSAQNDCGTSLNASQQVSDATSPEVQHTDMQVSSSAQNDYDTSLDASQPVIQVSNVASPEDQYSDVQVSSAAQNDHGQSSHTSHFSISQLTDVSPVETHTN